jgi:hypothetical protein
MACLAFVVEAEVASATAMMGLATVVVAVPVMDIVDIVTIYSPSKYIYANKYHICSMQYLDQVLEYIGTIYSYSAAKIPGAYNYIREIVMH